FLTTTPRLHRALLFPYTPLFRSVPHSLPAIAIVEDECPSHDSAQRMGDQMDRRIFLKPTTETSFQLCSCEFNPLTPVINKGSDIPALEQCNQQFAVRAFRDAGRINGCIRCCLTSSSRAELQLFKASLGDREGAKPDRLFLFT